MAGIIVKASVFLAAFAPVFGKWQPSSLLSSSSASSSPWWWYSGRQWRPVYGEEQGDVEARPRWGCQLGGRLCCSENTTMMMRMSFTRMRIMRMRIIRMRIVENYWFLDNMVSGRDVRSLRWSWQTSKLDWHQDWGERRRCLLQMIFFQFRIDSFCITRESLCNFFQINCGFSTYSWVNENWAFLAENYVILEYFLTRNM